MMITKEQALEDLIRLEGDLGEDWEALERIRAYIGQSQPDPGWVLVAVEPTEGIAEQALAKSLRDN